MYYTFRRLIGKHSGAIMIYRTKKLIDAEDIIFHLKEMFLLGVLFSSSVSLPLNWHYGNILSRGPMSNNRCI